MEAPPASPVFGLFIPPTVPTLGATSRKHASKNSVAGWWKGPSSLLHILRPRGPWRLQLSLPSALSRQVFHLRHEGLRPSSLEPSVSPAPTLNTCLDPSLHQDLRELGTEIKSATTGLGGWKSLWGVEQAWLPLVRKGPPRRGVPSWPASFCCLFLLPGPMGGA